VKAGKLIKRRWPFYPALYLILLWCGLLIGFADAGERVKPFLIGALTDSWGPTPGVVGLRDGLQGLGYREHEDFVLGVRFTQGDISALPAAARELVQHGVDLIFASEDFSAKAAQMATKRIPIVFAGVGDPLGAELIQSFARPGGNITGVSDLALELAPKRLEIFKEIIPGLKRVLFPYAASDGYSVEEAKSYRDTAQRLGIELVEKPIGTEEEARAIIARLQKGDVDGILKPRFLALNIPAFILEATVQRGIPAMFEGAFWVEQGALASYGADFYTSGRQAARLVDKILKGANPGEIPVEVNPKIELAINLQAAKALGLTISPEVLYRADRLVR
jgi:putative tryptophan/tyrosine transport system substrate-binding protein